MGRRKTDWLSLGLESWQLGLEAGEVMWLRGCMLAMGGPAGEREARRMVAEKLAANATFGMMVASGKAGTSPEAATRSALAHYGRRVRANRRRLAKTKP